MNAEATKRELELAAWEMAEAESHEKQAKSLRDKAVKRIAACHLEIKTAIEESKSKKPR